MSSSAWVPVVGTLSGVAVGSLVTLLLEELRWRRQDRARWYGDRRRVFASFLHMTSAVLEAGNELGAAIAEARSSGSDESAWKGLGRFQEAIDGLGPVRWELELLAGREVREAVMRIGNASTSLVARQMGITDPGSREGVAADLHELVIATDAFKQAARKEIGLPPE